MLQQSMRCGAHGWWRPVAAVWFCAGLAACGGGATSSAPAGEPVDSSADTVLINSSAVEAQTDQVLVRLVEELAGQQFEERAAEYGRRRDAVVGWLREAPITTPSPDEVAEVFETPWDFLMDAANHRRDFYDMDEGLRRWFWAMPWGERYIWGVTAGILKALHVRLYGDEAAPEAAADEDAA